VTLWAWSSRHDLRALPPDVDAAVLLAEVTVSPTDFVVTRRTQPVLLPTARQPVAVVRLETHGRGLNPELHPRLVEALATRALDAQASGLQVDFDARPPEYEAYRAFLRALRARLPDLRLSMTALASWCAENPPWFDGVPRGAVALGARRMRRACAAAQPHQHRERRRHRPDGPAGGEVGLLEPDAGAAPPARLQALTEARVARTGGLAPADLRPP
jgi:hypothetical protein